MIHLKLRAGVGRRVLQLMGLLLLSCTAPVYLERAEVEPGFTMGVGLGGGIGDGIVAKYNPDIPAFGGASFASGVGALSLRYGLSPNTGLYLQGQAGGAYFLPNNDPDDLPLAFDIQAGAKFRVTERGAIRAGVGLFSIAEVAYLYDISDLVTANADIGLLRGVGVGIGLYPRISDRWRAVIGLNVGTPPPLQILDPYPGRTLLPSVSLGVGLERTNPGQ